MPKILGKGSVFIANGIPLCWREIDYEIQRVLQESTGSTSYDPTGGVIYGSSRVTKIWIEAHVSGWYDTVIVPAALLSWLFSGSDAVPCSIISPGAIIAGSGNMDISQFRSTTPFDNVVSYTMTVRSNGFWSPS